MTLFVTIFFRRGKCNIADCDFWRVKIRIILKKCFKCKRIHNRFLLEIISEVRKQVGDDYPLVLRFSVVDYMDGGTNLAESLVTARLAEAAGINAISCSVGTYGVNYAIIPPSDTPRGLYISNATAIKDGVSIPVMGTGRINDPY